MPTNDQRDFAYLQAAAREARAKDVPYLSHLNQAIGIWNYIRIANDIAAQVPPGALLDWGCGYGQMTYLLRQRGFNVTAFDVGPADATLPDIALYRDLHVVRTEHPTSLPFEGDTFDAVLSSGVLEHVDEHSEPGNELKSLAEIARVLKPGGVLLIYQLPQRYAWKESLIRRFKLGYAHPRRYTAAEITTMLQSRGFRVGRIRRANLLPRNLTGVSERWRTLYSRFSHLLLALDTLLCRVPLLNQLAGVLEVTATRS